ncbi:MAG TPA: hypothetical protein VK929_06350 [Longimicrobiales bacterium]|nr:hypothetical protein [Longimicrobiales bacterium]
MRSVSRRAAAAAASFFLVCAAQVTAQHMPGMDHAGHGDQPGQHEMYMRDLGGGWRLLGMAQLFPMVSTGFGSGANDAVTGTEFYLNQPVIMFNVESPGSRVTLRTTLNFEGITQADGELTFGGWGEGFIDKRHPHTLLHEAVLSANFGNVAGGAASISAGKGFAPYGTDDPMSRPVAKFPTNHHLSQILERFLVSAAWLRDGFSLEAGVFGGNEPTGPYDFSNIESFGNSFSGRVAYRFGGDDVRPWEASASFGHVVEEHHGTDYTTRLVNAALRHEASYGFGGLYGLLEASRSMPAADDDDGYWSVLGEAQLHRGGHRPYARVEVATRPEYAREGAVGTDGFFRYDHDSHAIGATRWFIGTVGYGYDATRLPYSVRPFVEVQYNNVVNERGGIAAQELFGTNNFFGLTAGFRLFVGGGPMRMGAYGVLDAMTAHGGMTDHGAGHDMHDGHH